MVTSKLCPRRTTSSIRVLVCAIFLSRLHAIPTRDIHAALIHPPMIPSLHFIKFHIHPPCNVQKVLRELPRALSLQDIYILELGLEDRLQLAPQLLVLQVLQVLSPSSTTRISMSIKQTRCSMNIVCARATYELCSVQVAAKFSRSLVAPIAWESGDVQACSANIGH